MLKKLKKSYSTLDKIDPSSPAAKKMTALLDKMEEEQLKAIVKADIKFISLLAVNRLIRMGYKAKDIQKLKTEQIDMKDMLDRWEVNEAKSSTGYELYHKDFSTAMQHAYAHAKKKFGITIDPKEIDDKVATGPKKPASGKTNKYRLKGDRGAIQVQVYNTGSKYELNMYKEEVELDESPFSGKGVWDKMKFPTKGVKTVHPKKSKKGKKEEN